MHLKTFYWIALIINLVAIFGNGAVFIATPDLFTAFFITINMACLVWLYKDWPTKEQ